MPLLLKRGLVESGLSSNSWIEMFEFLKSDTFNTAFSGLIGVALVMLFYPSCKGDCMVRKAPPVEEIRSSTYQLADKCYNFEAKSVRCPSDGGAIEAFRSQ